MRLAQPEMDAAERSRHRHDDLHRNQVPFGDVEGRKHLLAAVAVERGSGDQLAVRREHLLITGHHIRGTRHDDAQRVSAGHLRT